MSESHLFSNFVLSHVPHGGRTLKCEGVSIGNASHLKNHKMLILSLSKTRYIVQVGPPSKSSTYILMWVLVSFWCDISVTSIPKRDILRDIKRMSESCKYPHLDLCSGVHSADIIPMRFLPYRANTSAVLQASGNRFQGRILKTYGKKNARLKTESGNLHKGCRGQPAPKLILG